MKQFLHLENTKYGVYISGIVLCNAALFFLKKMDAFFLFHFPLLPLNPRSGIIRQFFIKQINNKAYNNINV